ncbi:MAG: hypothetical protein MZV63_18195 [Marinilabiliales bacterium]|nr:hypothetical protein [Marinilabiliales bacterium]
MLYDLKLMDPARHKAATGVSNDAHPRQPPGAGRRATPAIWIRVPVIPGVNDDDGNIEATADFVRSAARHPRRSTCCRITRPARRSSPALGLDYALHGTPPPEQRRLDALAAHVPRPGPRDDHRRTTHDRPHRTPAPRQPRRRSRPSAASARPSLTAFYREHMGRHSTPVLRAMNFYAICDRKTLWIGRRRADRRRARPAAQGRADLSRADLPQRSRTCASSNSRPEDALRRRRGRHPAPTSARSSPTGAGRSHARPACSPSCPQEWHDAYEAGLFTEFMEQRAPGHTVLDGKIYRKGMLDFKRDIAARRGRARLPARPARPLDQARAAAGDGDRLRRGHPLRRAPRRAGRALAAADEPTPRAGPSC